MSVLDKFLNAMKLNDEEDFDDEDFLDDEEEFVEPRPKRRITNNRDEDDDLLDDIKVKPSYDTEEKYSSSSMKNKTSALASSKKQNKVSSLKPRRNSNNNGMEVCVIKPHSMEDSREITETLLANCTVVLNLEGLDIDIAQRIIDFTSGSCYAIDGNLQKISGNIFIITPSSVDISGDFQEILSGAFDVPHFDRKF